MRSLVSSLVHNGVNTAFASPGSRNTPVLLALADNPEIRVHVALDERAAGFLALGYARASGRPVVLSCTSGSAAANYLPAVVEAAATRSPLVVLTADRPQDLHHTGAHQTMDQLRLYGVHARWFADVPAEASDRWRALVAARAVAAASAGPVHLNLHARKPLWAPDAPTPAVATPPRVCAARAIPDLAAVEELVGAARRGVIVCGPHAGVPARDLRRLSERLGWPALADVGSGLRFSRGPGTVVCGYATIVGDPPRDLTPDLVLRFGRTPTSATLVDWLADCPTVLFDQEGDADRIVGGDPGVACRAIGGAGTEDGWAAAWRAAEERAQGTIERTCRPADAVWEGAVARRLVGALPEGAALHAASSMAIRNLDAFSGALEREVRVFCSRGVNGIDGTLATAAGEALAHRDGPLALLCGDLTLLHDVGGLIAAIELGVRMSVVVVDNGGGGIFGLLPIAENEHFEELFLTPRRADLGALCRAAGANFTDVRDVEALLAAVRADLESPGVGVIRIVVDREVDTRIRREIGVGLG